MTVSEHEDGRLEELLPWYVNGTLIGDEERQVRRFVEDNAQAARDVEILRQLRDAVRSQEHGSPGELGLRRLQASLREGRSPGSSPSVGRWWRPVLAAAAALVIVIQGVLLMNAWQRPAAYEPAGVAPAGSVIQLQFMPGATEQQITELLTRLDMEIVKGPSSVGVYRVAPVHEGADPKTLVARLRAADKIVKFAQIE